ncbi:MAG: SH3 domain-containing protein, partial [Leptolyngbyaceae bacterium]|nr:SH3 domain-containing protein [Leptolyngbyaceae bacterium]
MVRLSLGLEEVRMEVRRSPAIGLWCVVMMIIVTACGSASNQDSQPVDEAVSSSSTPLNEIDEVSSRPEGEPGKETPNVESEEKPRQSVDDTYPVKPPAEAAPRQPLQLSDEGQTSGDFIAFRNTLRQAVQNRDAEFIRAIAAPGIRLTFGLPITIEDLDLDNPNAPFWKHMEKAIATGCANEVFGVAPERESWICPHVFLAPDALPSIDPYEDIVIVGENINVRSAPTDDSPVIDTVSNEVVRHDYDSANEMTDAQRQAMSTLEGWQPIITSTGQRGYVSSRYAYSPIGYRAFFT